VAITVNPVNTTCSWEAVVKSFNNQSVTGRTNKALEAGHEINPLQMEGGEVFAKESLEKDFHNLSYVMGDDEKKKILKQRLSTKKSLTMNETALYLHVMHGWSHHECLDFINKHMK
jgi:hypothetical protein